MKKRSSTKLFEVMKLCSVPWILTCALASAPTAYDTKAQILDQEVTVNISGTPFENALTQIEELTNVNFFYNTDQMAGERDVTLIFTRSKLGTVLDALFSPRDIKYKVHERERTITLRKETTDENHQQSRSKPKIEQPEQKMFATVTGTVTDSNGQPMAGVNIVVKGTTVGTSTDSEGKYSIQAQADDILVFSFIGYSSFEAQVGDRSTIDVVLNEDIRSLNEVEVNAGYWRVTDRKRTGNISRVSAEDLEYQPISNPLMGVPGRIPGVVVTQTSGVPGSGMRLQIRGQNSLRNGTTNNGNYPLYVIDGVPVASTPVESYGGLLRVGGIDPLNTISPANIESIEILKDADATAIYGSRGSNGVVLITTKKGESGKTKLDAQAYFGLGRASKMMNVMNTEEYLSMRKEAFLNDGAEPGLSDYDLNGTWDQNSYTDWQEVLFGGSARLSDFQVSIAGGNPSTSFLLGGGYHKETTVFPGDFGYTKGTAHLNLKHDTPDDKFGLTLSINYGYDNNELFDKNIASYAVTLPPNSPVYDSNGNLDWSGYTSSDRMHPLSFFETSHTSQTASLISSTVLNYQVMKGLKLIASFGFNDSNTDQVVNTPRTSMNPSNPRPSRTTLMGNKATNWIAEPQIAYTAAGAQGKLDILIGGTWQKYVSKNSIIEGQGFSSDALLGNIRAASSILILDDSNTEYRYSAVFGRIGYSWMDKYLVNLTARRDGSSRFGANNQFGNFGAVGAAWIFSNENFVHDNISFLSFGKLRTSYGTTGSDQIGDYGYQSTYSPSSASYDGAAVLNPTALANPDFGWEVNRKLEAAIDLGMFNDKIVFSASWYRNRSSNQLVGYPLPSITGFTSVQYNLDATVQNSGWEFELNSTQTYNGLEWLIGLNLTIPRNELVVTHR